MKNECVTILANLERIGTSDTYTLTDAFVHRNISHATLRILEPVIYQGAERVDGVTLHVFDRKALEAELGITQARAKQIDTPEREMLR